MTETNTPTTPTSIPRTIGLAAAAALITLGLMLATALLAASWAEASIRPTTEERIAEHQADARRFERAMSLEGQLARACDAGTGWACGLRVEGPSPDGQAAVHVIEPIEDQGELIRRLTTHVPPADYDDMAAEILDHAPIGTERVIIGRPGEFLGLAPRPVAAP